jgi:hypothetical protein
MRTLGFLYVSSRYRSFMGFKWYALFLFPVQPKDFIDNRCSHLGSVFPYKAGTELQVLSDFQQRLEGVMGARKSGRWALNCSLYLSRVWKGIVIYIFLLKTKKKKIIFPDALPENVAHEIYWLSFDDHPKKAFIVVIVLHYFFSLSLLSSLSPFSLRPLLRASV